MISLIYCEAKRKVMDKDKIAGTARTTERKSSIELARMLAMSAIVIWHFMIHGGLLRQSEGLRFVMPLFIWGVDLFILVSGYFLVTINWKSILRLILVVWTYSLISLLAEVSLFSDYGHVQDFMRVLKCPLSGSSFWFVNYYVALIVISPFLNLGLRGIEIHKLRILVLILTIMECYSGWIMSALYNGDGYSLFSFIYLYILGYYLRRDEYIMRLPAKTIILVGLGAIMANLLLNGYLLSRHEAIEFSSTDGINLAYIKSMLYNNPFTILFASCLLVYLSRLSFKSKAVNSIASASFGVYLLQEGYCSGIIYNFISLLPINVGAYETLLACMVVFVALWVLSWLIMQIVGPLSGMLNSIIHRYVPSKYLIDVRRC